MANLYANELFLKKWLADRLFLDPDVYRSRGGVVTSKKQHQGFFEGEWVALRENNQPFLKYPPQFNSPYMRITVKLLTIEDVAMDAGVLYAYTPIQIRDVMMGVTTGRDETKVIRPNGGKQSGYYVRVRFENVPDKDNEFETANFSVMMVDDGGHLTVWDFEKAGKFLKNIAQNLYYRSAVETSNGGLIAPMAKQTALDRLTEKFNHVSLANITAKSIALNDKYVASQNTPKGRQLALAALPYQSGYRLNLKMFSLILPQLAIFGDMVRAKNVVDE